MPQKTYLWLFLSASIILALPHLLGESLGLYRAFWWYDIPMHFLGGMAVGFGVLWGMKQCGLLRDALEEDLFTLLVGVLAVGVAWEVFEYFIGFYDRPLFTLVIDTSTDILMDVFGGVVAYGVTGLIRLRKRTT